jgi:uncharacterized membrane protein YfcA
MYISFSNKNDESISPFILIIIGFFSEILGTIGGFGSSTIFLPLATYLVEF